MYPNLNAELARRGINRKILAGKLRISYRSLLNKLTGITEFTRAEMCEIKNLVAPGMTLDYLFTQDEKAVDEPLRKEDPHESHDQS